MTSASEPQTNDLVRRRHVFYIAGYDPQGVDAYYGLFRRELARFAKVWSLKTLISKPEADPDGLAAHWNVETSGLNWRVTTTYEYLQWDDLIQADMAQPNFRRYPRIAALFLRNAVNGVILRLFIASWRFGLFYLYPAVALALLAAIPIALGWLTARGVFALVPFVPLAVMAGLVVFVVAYWQGKKLADKAYLVQLTDAWLWADDWVKGRKPEFTTRLDAFAARIIARARANEVDEIVVIGHSGGAVVCAPLIARALELDSDFASGVPRFAALALGTLVPILGFYPQGERFRAAVRRVAAEPSVTYVDCQVRKDVMNLYGCDPFKEAGVAPAEQRNSLLWRLRFRDMLDPASYARLRWNFFRMHFQFIMAGERRAPYEYFMLVCGPAPVVDWATRGPEMVASFAPDGSFARASGSQSDGPMP